MLSKKQASQLSAHSPAGVVGYRESRVVFESIEKLVTFFKFISVSCKHTRLQKSIQVKEGSVVMAQPSAQ